MRREHQRKTPYHVKLVVKSTRTGNIDILVRFDKPTFQRLRNRDIIIVMTVTDMNAHAKEEYRYNVRPTESLITLQCKSNLKLGRQYRFQLNIYGWIYSPVSRKFVPILKEMAIHKEVLLKSELEELMSKAVEYSESGNSQWLPVKFAYRNKTSTYFAHIMQRRRGIMEVYLKDNNGDPGCPINGQIEGLFFAVRPDPETGLIPEISPFGNTRVIIPIRKLLNTHVHLYFADFYCTNSKKLHYVTLVATQLNSDTDRFCARHLPRLSLNRNRFLTFQSSPEYHGYLCCEEPRVELLYTENIDLNEPFTYWENDVQIIGNGSSTPGGLSKRRTCKVCNLYS